MVCSAKAGGEDLLDRAGTCIAGWWHSAYHASRMSLSLAHSQLVVLYPLLHPVPCWPFLREPGASYLQELQFKQACKHMLESH